MTDESTPAKRPRGPLLPAPAPEDVADAAEDIRARDYPDVPGRLLSAVLAAERDHPDERIAAARAVEQAVNAYLVQEA